MSNVDYSRRRKNQILWYGNGILTILVILLIALPRL